MKLKTLLNEKGFTLIEMLIVLMIISLLLMIVVPNLTKNNNTAQEASCKGTVKLVQAQVYAYNLEEGGNLTSLEPLISNGYVDSIKCYNDQDVELDVDTQIVSEPKPKPLPAS
ncbi:prepilin-type N-terminal cleavage/methylation domain-containing protein [Bacillus sp. YZJH907-2]|uniref:ComG operon protein 3 n=1 Tax=Halalkalibacter suaedae TaxID=2822140 RepID=A0A941AP39_9BACI|nr:prepilin-type N-terminal cleavage/methylation domain-containing protein [Bacillus suaedae]